MKSLASLVAGAATLLAAANTSSAHFPWLVLTDTQNNKSQLHVYFSESASDNDPDLLEYVADAEVWQLRADGETQKLALERSDEALTAKANGADSNLFVLEHDYGVLQRGDETFLLQYYAKTGPPLGRAAWNKTSESDVLALDIIPRADQDSVELTVLWKNEPVADAQVVVQGPGVEDVELETDKSGKATFELGDAGLYSIRARHVQDQSGELDGKKYASIRHYCTLALTVPKSTASKKGLAMTLPDIPQTVTSFGAAIADDRLYMYGGHTGSAHSYSNAEQSNVLWKLELSKPAAWKKLATGPRLQGLALVAHDGRLYRIGGFTAKNEEGEEHDLWSQDDVASFDEKSEEWSPMPSLPEPRSSFDAAVLDNRIYVVGGWQLRGSEETVWHDSAYVLDPAADKPQWQPIADPPFRRRAHALAAYNGKIFVIGGMQPDGPTTSVEIYDPETDKWTSGPALEGEPMEGFGNSAFAQDGRLYVSTIEGNLQRLSADGSSWETVHELERARFFHRMLPYGSRQLLFVGGANMSIGKFEQVDVVNVP